MTGHIRHINLDSPVASGNDREQCSQIYEVSPYHRIHHSEILSVTQRTGTPPTLGLLQPAPLILATPAMFE